MRIAVLNNWVPFLRGGAEQFATTLVHELRVHGHSAELVKVPLRWEHPGRVRDSMLSAALLQVEGADRVIGLKFPAYLVPHPDRVVWLIHQFRQVYDLWDDASADESWRPLKRSIVAADRLALGAPARTWCISEAVSDRLREHNGITAPVLRSPLVDPGQYRCDEYGDYVLCAGRINASKRQLLAVQAMRHTRSGVRLVVAGPPDSADDLAALRREVDAHSLHSKVVIIPEFLSEERKVELHARSLASAYLPYQEDSYGYVTAESMLSHKAVVTTTDSGDLKVLVQDGTTGLVVPPDPVEVAAALDRLAADRPLARRLGVAARSAVEGLDLTWDRAVSTLSAR